MSRFN